MPNLNNLNYSPDILNCLANLSSDEIFTPPSLVKAMLDLLPTSLWSNPDARFLDPATKSGIFLREIAKRLLEGLKEAIPDDQARRDHIYGRQLYGLAITQLTGLMARRTVYCSKRANGKYSVAEIFKDEQGHIFYHAVAHRWHQGRCTDCGASQSEYDRDTKLETHAYQFIHPLPPNPAKPLEELFTMKFDVIIGNPPYQLDTGGSNKQAKPIYQYFVRQAKKMKPRYLVMIIPSRWFAGGMGLDEFRSEMLEDKGISTLVDFTNAKDCFPGISLSGGVNYFIWGKEHDGPCQYTCIHDGQKNTLIRFLDEFPVLVRFNEAVNIIHKIQAKNEPVVSSIVSSINPFGFPTSARGSLEASTGMYRLYSSKGTGYVKSSEIVQGRDLADKYKVMVSQTISEHAGEPGKDGKFKLLSTVKVLLPREICTFSYITVGAYGTKVEAINLEKYLKTKFVRFLILQAVSSIHLSKGKFIFVPIQDFTQSWTDEKLYAKYGLVSEEINFIETMIRPMDTDTKADGKISEVDESEADDA